MSAWETNLLALVAAIRRSGPIVLGKTRLCATSDKHCETRLHTHPDYSCGGSSGGAAGSIAAGIGHFAIASDSSGSIRLPAALCGIVGFKTGKWSLPWAEHTGILARSVRDVATVLNWTSEQDRESPDRHSVLNPRFWQDKMVSKNITVGVSLRLGLDETEVDTELISQLQEAVEKLRVQGVTVHVLEDSPEYQHICKIWPADVLTAAKARWHDRIADSIRRKKHIIAKALRFNLQEFLHDVQLSTVTDATSNRLHCTMGFYKDVRGYRDIALQQLGEEKSTNPDVVFDAVCKMLIDNVLLARIQKPSSDGLVALSDTMKATLVTSVQTLMDKVKYLITPSLPMRAYAVDSLPSSDPMQPARFLFPFNYTGHTAMSVPIGFDKNSMPIGAQVVGPKEMRTQDDLTAMLWLAHTLSERPEVMRPVFPFKN